MAKVKGSVVLTRLEYFKQNGQYEEFLNILPQLDPDFRRELELGVMNIKWYDYDQYLHFLEVTDRVFGQGDFQLIEDMGHFSATKAFSGIYRVFAKVGYPEYILKLAAQVWRQIADSGDLVVKDLGGKRASAELAGFPIASMALCRSLKGWIRGTLEVCGGKEVQVEITGTPENGQPIYRYLSSWK